MGNYIGSYDGIRVIALIGVVFYHLIPSVFKSGYLGVVTFFVMAGFLTINQGMKIEKQDKRINLILEKTKDKLLKLYPALMGMIFFVSLFIFFFFRADLGAIANDIKTSLLSIYNYAEIFSGGSYFENTGKLDPFSHLWALSLEIQVYILAFIFFYGNYKPSRKENWFKIFLLVTILSYGFSSFLLYRGADLNRVYYGTGTRLYSFLIGAMAALVSDKKRERLSNKFNEGLIVILLLISIGCFFIFDINGFVLNYIFPIYSILIAILMILLKQSKGYTAKILSSKPFKTISKRSYHIYLWHFPIIAIQEKMMANTIVSNGYFYLIFFALCIILSEISYRLNSQVIKLQDRQKKWITPIVIVSFLLLFIVPYEAISESSKEKQALDDMKATILENERIQKEKIEKEKIEEEAKREEESYKDTEETEFSKSYYNAIEAIEWVNELDESLYLDPDLYTKFRQIKGVLIGDSLASMSYHTLYTYMPNFEFDSNHSRQMKDALEDYTPYMDKNDGDYIILSLGTNGEVLHEDIDKVRDANRDKNIILNTIVLPYKNQEEERNASIRSYEKLYDNVYLADWYAAAKDKPEVFFDDKIHTGEKGARIMSQIMMKKIIEIETSKK